MVVWPLTCSYTKSTDCHQYLHCSSTHPDHLQNSIIYSQAFRLCNICTYERDFRRHALDMKLWFLETGEGILKGSDWFTNGNQRWNLGRKSRNPISVTGVPLVITYHSKLREIMKKYQNILYQDEPVKQVFTPFLFSNGFKS